MATQDQKASNGVNPLAVGMAGMLVGGAVGAAAVAFSDKKNRTEAVKKLNMAKDSLNKWSDKVTVQAQKFSGKTKASLGIKADELKQKADDLAADVNDPVAA